MLVALFKRIIVVYSENHQKHLNTLWGQNIELPSIKESDKYSYQYDLKDCHDRLNETTNKLCVDNRTRGRLKYIVGVLHI
jgi:hypothetical protein